MCLCSLCSIWPVIHASLCCSRADLLSTVGLQAEAARNEADRLRREAQAEAHAAAAAAEAERNTRAEAEGTSEALRQDAERRARVFNNAVKAAVGRVQRELEGERDELQVCEGRDGRGGGAQGGEGARVQPCG